MLEEIRIRDLGVIDEAVLELGPGLTVITGETGAGKTMLLTALDLLLGGRADPALVRGGASRALVEGRVRAGPALAARVEEVGAELDEDSLVLARTVSAEGRSRAFLGGRSVPAALLAELGEDLVSVHGQSEQQRLRRPGRQRAALDRFARLDGLLQAYGASYARHRDVAVALTELVRDARRRAQEADLLRLGLAEIAAVAPEAGEDAALRAEAARLAHVDALRAAAAGAHEALVSDGATGTDALGLVAAARRALDAAGDHDPALAGLAGRLAEAGYLLADVAADLASYAADLDADPARLAAVHDRLAQLGRLTRKYGDDAAAVLEWGRQAASRLATLDGDDERIAALSEERERGVAQLADLAGQLHAARAAAAERFAAAVGAELEALAMPRAVVQALVDVREDPAGLLVELPEGGRSVAYGPGGVDEVELRLAAHPGAPPRPLDKGASGGELSRVLLAIEVVFAGADPVPTMVFDEVDAGVGGRAATEVGRRLARLAATAQVLVVTHLAQVAAYADRHLLVTKSSDGQVTFTGVRALEPAARVRELSRMLAGVEESALAQGHAEELLATAQRERRRPQAPGASRPRLHAPGLAP